MPSSLGSLTAVQKKRNELFLQRFNLPDTEELIADFICALQQKILYQGRLFISQHYVCFYAKVFGDVIQHVIRASDITKVTPAKSLGMIPNAIKVTTPYSTYFFTSFISRNAALALLDRVSKGDQLGKEDIVMEPSKAKASDNGDQEDQREDSRNRGGEDDDDNESNDDHRATNKKRTTPQKKAPPQRKNTRQSKRQQTAEDDDDEAHNDAHSNVDDENDSGTPPARKPVQKKMTSRSPPKMNGINAKGRPAPRREDDDAEDDNDDAAHAPEKKAAADSDEEHSDTERNDKKRTYQLAKPKRNIRPRHAEHDDDDNHDDDNGDIRRRKTPNVDDSSASSDDDDDDDEILQKLKSSRKRSKGDYSSIYLYPSLSTSTDPKVDTAHSQIRKQPLSMAIASPTRRWIYEGPLRRQGRWSVVDRWCFLFSDVFVFTKQIDVKRYQMKQWGWLEELTVDARPRQFQTFHRKTKLPHPFRLIFTSTTTTSKPPLPPPPTTTTRGSTATTPAPAPAPSSASIVQQYIVSTDSAAKQQEWCTRLLLAIAGYHYNRNPEISHPFGWYYHYLLGTIHQAVFDKDVALCNALIAKDPDCVHQNDIENRGVLHICAEQDDATMIPILLTAGAKITALDHDNYTPIHIAAKKGSLAVLNALLADTTNNPIDFTLIHNSTRKQKNYKDNSALWLTVLNHQQQYHEVFAVLLSLSKVTERKQIMEDRDDDGMTLLETACHQHLMDVIPLLIKHGAHVDTPNRQGLTPLCVAAKANDLKLVEVLIHCGAQPNLRFLPGLNAPVHYATDLQVVSYLVSTGARTGLRNSKGVRVSDVYAAPREQTVLTQAEELHAKRPAIDTDDPMYPQAHTVALNGGHSLESCALCQEEYTVLRKRDYCRRCGLNVDQACSSKKLIFRRKRNGKKERVLARVCDGCYNIVMFRASPDGGIGSTASKQLKIKKKVRPTTAGAGQYDAATGAGSGVERSRKGVSVSRRWEDIESEEDEADHTRTHMEGGGPDDTDSTDVNSSGVPTPTGASGRSHRRGSSTDPDDSEIVEDGAGITGNIKTGLKKGFKGALKVGGFIGGKLTNVFDSVTDTLTSVAVPKDGVHKTGAVHDTQSPAGVGVTGGAGVGSSADYGAAGSNLSYGDEGDSGDAATDVRSTPAKRGVSRTKSTASTAAGVGSSGGNTAATRDTAASTRSAAGRARGQASSNLKQLRGVEDRAGTVNDEAADFGSLAVQLKKKNTGV